MVKFWITFHFIIKVHITLQLLLKQNILPFPLNLINKICLLEHKNFLFSHSHPWGNVSNCLSTAFSLSPSCRLYFLLTDTTWMHLPTSLLSWSHTLTSKAARVKSCQAFSATHDRQSQTERLPPTQANTRKCSAIKTGTRTESKQTQTTKNFRQ